MQKNEGFHTAFKKNYKDIYILYSIEDDDMSKKEKEQRHGNQDTYPSSLAVTILKPDSRYKPTALPTSS
jgi:hypothetical protein